MPALLEANELKADRRQLKAGGGRRPATELWASLQFAGAAFTILPQSG
jgi:hypothetical protein